MNNKHVVTTATLAAAVLAGISVSTNVKADKLSTNNGETQQNAQAPWQARVNQAQQNVNSAQGNLNTANAAVSNAQGKAMTAQNQLTSAQDAVNDQQAVVDIAQTKVNSASALASSTQQVLDDANQVTSSTPAEITKTKQEITNQNNQIQSDQVALDNAKSAATESNEKLNAAKDQVTKTTGQKSDQQAVVDRAQQAYNKANAALTDSKKRVTELENALTTVQKDVETAKAAVTTAKMNVNSAQQAKVTTSQAIKNAENNVQAAQSAVTAAKAEQQKVTDQTKAANDKFNQDESALSEAQQAVKEAQSALDQLKGDSDSQTDSLPTFNFTPAQAAATQQLAREVATKVANNQYSGTDTIEKLPSFKNWESVMTNSQLQNYYDNQQGAQYFDALAKTYNNWTDQSSQDKNTIIDLKNVTAAQAQELSVFTANLFNKIINQLGISNFASKNVATKGAAEIAGEVAKICTENNAAGGHYLYALHKAYYDHGLSTTPATDAEKYLAESNGFGESLTTYSSTAVSSKVSMAAAKERLVQGIAGMIYADEDSDMSHTTAICGINNIYNQGKGQPIGVAPSFANVSGGCNAIAFHINQPDIDLLDSSNAKQSGINTPLSQESKNILSKDELAQAQANLAAKQKDEATKQAAVDADNMLLVQLEQTWTGKQQKVHQARAKLNDANAALASQRPTLAAAQDQIKVAQDSLTSAQTQQRAAEQRILAAGQAVVTARGDQQAKQAATNSAQHKLASEKAKLDSINQQLTTQTAILIAAQQDYSSKQQAVTAATKVFNESQVRLQDLTNRLKAMQGHAGSAQQDQVALDKAKLALAAAQQEFQKQQGILAQLRQQEAVRQTDVTNAQAVLKKAQAQATEAKTALVKAQADLANAQPDAVKYGQLVKIKPIIITLGDNVPNPTIINSSVVVNTPVTQSPLVLMVGPGKQLPTGTTAKWTNRDQVKRDAAKVGTSTEDVLVAFPDMSTYLIHGVSLTVQPVATKPTQLSGQPAQLSEEPTQSSDQPTQPSEEPIQPSEGLTQSSWQPMLSGGGATQLNESALTSPEHPATGIAGDQDRQLNTGVQSINNYPSDGGLQQNAVSGMSNSVGQATSKQTAKQLPQTGNNSDSVLSSVVSTCTLVISLFGIKKRYN